MHRIRCRYFAQAQGLQPGLGDLYAHGEVAVGFR